MKIYKKYKQRVQVSLFSFLKIILFLCDILAMFFENSFSEAHFFRKKLKNELKLIEKDFFK